MSSLFFTAQFILQVLRIVNIKSFEAVIVYNEDSSIRGLIRLQEVNIQ